MDWIGLDCIVYHHFSIRSNLSYHSVYYYKRHNTRIKERNAPAVRVCIKCHPPLFF